jgi:hypothetical protein
MAELMCREVLAIQRKAARILQATVHQGEIRMHDVLTWDGLVWVCNGGTLTQHDNMFAGEWYAVAKDRTNIKKNYEAEIYGDGFELLQADDSFQPVAPLSVLGFGAVQTRGGSHLTAKITQGDTLTSVDIAMMGFDLDSGSELWLVNPYTGEHQQLTLTASMASDATSITVSDTADTDFPIGSWVVLDVTAVMANAGGEQYWQRTGTELTPATSGDNVEVTSNASQGAIKGISTDYSGVVGISSHTENPGVYGEGGRYGVRGTGTLVGVEGTCAGGWGLIGSGVTGISASGSSVGGVFSTTSASNLNIGLSVIQLFRNAGLGTPLDGIGGFVSMHLPTTGVGATTIRVAYMQYRLTTVNHATRTSVIEFATTNSGTEAIRLSILGTGQLQALQYGDGTFTGTPATTLNADTSGNVIETTYAEFPDLKVGDIAGGNYSELTTNGTYQAYGTATTWDDQQVQLGAVRLGSSAPTWTAYKGGEILSFAKNLNNKIFFICQLTHRYKEDSTIHFHIHYTVPDNNTGDTKWVLTYSWSDINSKFPTADTQPKVVSIAANSQDTHLVGEIYAPVPGTGQGGFSSMLICSLMREGTSDDDTYDNAAYLVGIDFHVEMDKLGTASEYSDAETTTTS